MIPLLIGGGVLGVLGLAGHSVAKDTNNEAAEVSNQAQKIYDDAKNALEPAYEHMEASLLELGNQKKRALDLCVKKFMPVYDSIKHIQINESTDMMDESSKFTFNSQQALQIQKMAGIYNSAITSGTAAAATSAIIALAVNGSLPIVTGTLSIAGTALSLGEIGIAAGLAGSALSFGAAMTPLGVIAGPAMFATALSASFKADENLEKAKALRAEARKKAEEMKAHTVLYKTIADKADLFCKLLSELTDTFAKGIYKMDKMVKAKVNWYTWKVDQSRLTEDDQKLIAITRSLAGAVKALIDTPILTENGELANAFQTEYDKANAVLPVFKKNVQQMT